MKSRETVKIFAEHAGIGNQIQFIPCLNNMFKNDINIDTDSAVLKSFFTDRFADINYADSGIVLFNIGYPYVKEYSKHCDSLVGFKYSVKNKIIPLVSSLYLDRSLPFDYSKSEIENNFDLVTLIWKDIKGNIDYSIPIERKTRANFIGIAAASGKHDEKRWKSWPNFIRELVDKDYHIFLFGKETGYNELLRDDIKKGSNVTVIYTSTLIAAARIIAQCEYFIANDTGLMHLADILKIPTLAIFGMTSIVKNSPLNKPNGIVSLNLSCSPCYKHGKIKCVNDELYKCMDISVDRVMKAFYNLKAANETTISE